MFFVCGATKACTLHLTGSLVTHHQLSMTPYPWSSKEDQFATSNLQSPLSDLQSPISTIDLQTPISNLHFLCSVTKTGDCDLQSPISTILLRISIDLQSPISTILLRTRIDLHYLEIGIAKCLCSTPVPDLFKMSLDGFEISNLEVLNGPVTLRGSTD